MVTGPAGRPSSVTSSGGRAGAAEQQTDNAGEGQTDSGSERGTEEERA